MDRWSNLERDPNVRAREDVRRDLMAARHRLSKLLLRQGIVYYGGHAWTQVHDTWLRSQHFDEPGLQLAYETAYDTMLAAELTGPPVEAARDDRSCVHIQSDTDPKMG